MVMMRAKHAAIVVFVAVLSIPAAGCDSPLFDFRVFDDLKDSTTVDSSGAPGDLDSRTYGVAIAAGGARADGASFIVVARNDDGFANLRYASDGTREDSALLLQSVSHDPPFHALALDPVIVGDPGAARAAVALTAGGPAEAPEQSEIGLLDTTNGALGSDTLTLTGAEIIRALAFGTTDVKGGDATTNLVVLRNRPESEGEPAQLVVIRDVANFNPDNNPEPVCNPAVGGGATSGFSALVADLAPDRTGAEIAVGVGSIDNADDRQVHILPGLHVSDAFENKPAEKEVADCFESGTRDPLATLTVASGGTGFGRVLAAGNFDGGGIDLVVSAPGSNVVYVYLDIDAAAALPTPASISAPADAADFGATLAVGDLDGDGNDELVVGAPNSKRDGKEGAGAAFIYKFSGGFGDPAIALSDAQPEDNQQFGQAMAMVPFGTGNDNILVVGADGEVFTYFRTGLGGSDVREGRQ